MWPVKTVIYNKDTKPSLGVLLRISNSSFSRLHEVQAFQLVEVWLFTPCQRFFQLEKNEACSRLTSSDK